MPAPNRLVGYAVAVLSLLVALLPVVGDVDWTTLAGAVAGLAAVSAVALKWLTGWQNMEKVNYQSVLLQQQAAAQAEEQARAIEAAQSAGSRRVGPKVSLPR